MTDLERRNGGVVSVISPNPVAFVAYYVKVDFLWLKIHRHLLAHDSASEM